MRSIKEKMSLSSKELTGFLGKSNRTMFDCSYEEQKGLLDKLGPAIDDFDRSFKQYKCHCLFQSRGYLLCMNVLSFLMLPFLILYALVHCPFIRRQCGNYDAIAADGLIARLPHELQGKYTILTQDISYDKVALRFKDILFPVKLFLKYPLHSFFVLKVTFKVSYYSYIFYKYSPQVMLVMNEYSYTSSVLTAFCEKYGVKHIDIMHGEKFFYIYDSYFRYHECWIWNDHYKKLFIAMQADPEQFHISIPPILRIDCDKYHNSALYADYKYYLQIFNEKQIQKVVKAMMALKSKGSTIMIRPHPIWSDVDLLKKYIGEEYIEDPKKVSIMESIANTKYAVASFSTVLNQAYYSGKGVILDDVAFLEQYQKLKSLWYPLIDMGAPKLSDFCS